jgi:hypothetical protein
MSITVKSNVSGITARMRAMAGGATEVVGELINTAEHASAVEAGYTREIVWAELTPRQRAIIIWYAKQNKDKKRKSEATVTKTPEKVTIVMPPVGIFAQTVPLVTAYAKTTLKALPSLSVKSLEQAKFDILLYWMAVASTVTPVDQSTMIQSWDIRG